LKSIRRHRLSKREANELLGSLSGVLRKSVQEKISRVKGLEVIEPSSTERIFILGDKPILIKIRDCVLPALLDEEVLGLFPSVIVDMGAIPYICNGADVMAPGIVGIDGEFTAGNIVVVRDERHRKAIAIGRSLYDSNTFREKRHGKMVKNLHFIGDDVWKIVKRSLIIRDREDITLA